MSHNAFETGPRPFFYFGHVGEQADSIKRIWLGTFSGGLRGYGMKMIRGIKVVTGSELLIQDNKERVGVRVNSRLKHLLR